jgi:hypothetical protein
LRSTKSKRSEGLRGFAPGFVALLISCAISPQNACLAQDESAVAPKPAPQRANSSANQAFDLKAVKNAQGNEELRIARPGGEDQIQGQASQSNLNGKVGRDDLAPLADPNSFQQGNAQFGRTQPFDLGTRQLNGSAQNNNTMLQVPMTVRLLADYQIELIVDRSLSMRRRDCPGGLSRWEWCGVQAEDLARAIAPFLPNGLTIIPFANRYDVYAGASAQNIADLFEHPNFEYGTRLAEPLSDRLNNFFAQRRVDQKPLLIAVITDGVPFPPPEPEMVRRELIHSTHKMNGPNEVTVVFFQIGGHDRFGRDYLDELGNNLTHEGARYDYVHTIPFNQLVAVGLSQALVQTIQTFVRNR